MPTRCPRDAHAAPPCARVDELAPCRATRAVGVRAEPAPPRAPAAPQLEQVDAKLLCANTPSAINEAAAQTSVVSDYEKAVTTWCSQVEGLLSEKEDAASPDEETGPRTELDYWRSRMGKLNSVIQQLSGDHCRAVLAVLQVSKSRILKRWKTNDSNITDAANEAKDNVKYLHTLDKYIEPLYSGKPQDVIDSLPGLLNNIKMMNTIARYYNTAQRMTTLLRKVTEQMIANCRAYVVEGGSLWEQSVPQLLARLNTCTECNRSYQAQYRQVREPLPS